MSLWSSHIKKKMENSKKNKKLMKLTVIAAITGLVFSVFLFIFKINPAFAVIETLQPNATVGKDSYMTGSLPDQTYGTNLWIYAGKSAGNGEKRQRILIEFDVSSIPSSAQITNATFTPYVANVGENFSLHRVTNFWSESE